MISVNDEIQIEIQGLGSFGEGIGSYNGYKIFVMGALPQEEVLVHLTECHKTYAHAKLLKILKTSSDRVKPPCPYFHLCGGCQIQHLPYEKQLLYKQQKVIDALQRIGKIDVSSVLPCISSPLPLHYRNKVQLPVRLEKNAIASGFYAHSSHDFIQIDHCLIHCEIGESIYKNIQKIFKESKIEPYDPQTGKGDLKHLIIKSAIHAKKVLIVLVTKTKKSKLLQELAKKIIQSSPLIHGVIHNIQSKESNTILGHSYEVLEGEESIQEILLDLTFHISAASFFQVNPLQAENLYRKAIEYADPNPTDIILDAYCGVGTLSLLFAKHAKKVIGIEIVPQAIENAKKNATLNRIQNVLFQVAKVETFIPTLKAVDTVLLNPPRKGCEATVLKEIARLKPEKVIYISCDPATLARDLAILHSFNYKLKEIQPYDMFPQTSHVETVALLKS